MKELVLNLINFESKSLESKKASLESLRIECDKKIAFHKKEIEKIKGIYLKHLNNFNNSLSQSILGNLDKKYGLESVLNTYKDYLFDCFYTPNTNSTGFNCSYVSKVLEEVNTHFKNTTSSNALLLSDSYFIDVLKLKYNLDISNLDTTKASTTESLGFNISDYVAYAPNYSNLVTASVDFSEIRKDKSLLKGVTGVSLVIKDSAYSTIKSRQSSSILNSRDIACFVLESLHHCLNLSYKDILKTVDRSLLSPRYIKDKDYKSEFHFADRYTYTLDSESIYIVGDGHNGGIDAIISLFTQVIKLYNLSDSDVLFILK